MSASPENRQILEEASAWCVEFRSGAATDSARREFAHWLRRSPEHIRAYMEISGTLAQLPRPASLTARDLERLIANTEARLTSDANVTTLTPGADAAPHATASDSPQTSRAIASSARPSRHLHPRRHRWVAAAVAATVLILTAFSVLLIVRDRGTYETAAGEQRTLTLEDGSTLELDARTRMKVAFARSHRDVELLAGQAYFHVAKDPRRPFRVHSGAALVQAIGTQFDVDREGPVTTVTVVEGRVSLQSPSPPTVPPSPFASSPRTPPTDALLADAIVLSAGEQAVVSPRRIERAVHPNIAATTAWAQGDVEFDETPLAQAVAAFNRRSAKPLVIASPAVASFKITGLYSPRDPHSFVLFLRSQPDLRVTETDDEIRIDAP